MSEDGSEGRFLYFLYYVFYVVSCVLDAARGDNGRYYIISMNISFYNLN